MLLIARHATQVVGAVQLELATKANAQHRAEVQKLCVLQQERRRGIGRLLMEAIEPMACERGRTLVVLDTRLGDHAERLYRKVGYVEVGIIPSYAQIATGTLEGYSPTPDIVGELSSARQPRQVWQQQSAWQNEKQVLKQIWRL